MAASREGDTGLLRTRYPDGGVERFFYDGTGNRTKHVLPEQYDGNMDDGEGRTYTYDRAGRLLTVTGPDGTVEETNAYDLWGNCVQRTDAEGYITHYTYDLLGRLVRELVPVGSGAEDVSYCMTEYAYDGNGNRIRETRYGGSYTEDGTLKEAGTDLILTFTYDARNRLVRVEDGLGARVSYGYDVRGNRTSEEQVINSGEGNDAGIVLKKIRYRYDKAGRLTEKREILDSGLREGADKRMGLAVTRYAYDANGNRTGIVTPEGYHITREYDCRDRLIVERLEDRENGIDLKTFFTYDKAGNVISVRQEGKEGQSREITYSHDLKDRLTRAEELDGPVVMASYDKNDRMAGRKDLLPVESEQYGSTQYSYDIRGNLTESRRNGKTAERNEYDRKDRIIGNTDGDGIEVHCRYGIQDEQRQFLTAGSRKQGKAAQTLIYDARGMVTGTEDGCGNRTGYQTDGWGRILSVETAEGGREEYAYDSAGNVTASADANGNTIRYAYNSQGKVCAITDQSGNTETFRYDREGRETEHTDRNGTVTETQYNVYGKPIMQICTDNKGNRQIMGTWEYDSFGQLTKSVAGGFCYTYEYRPDGKLLNKWSSGRKVQSCTYYRDGSLKSLTDVSGRTLLYEYDGEGRLGCLKEDTGIILTEYRYTTAGRIREIITGNGIHTTYTYDEDGNVSRLSIGDGTEEGLLYDAFMLYDLNGNRTGKKGTRLSADGKQAEMTVSYRYDAMNRLTNEDRGGAGERYAYDLCGNRLIREKYQSGSIDETEGYRYNERNELTECISAGSLTAYQYDAFGNLTEKKETISNRILYTSQQYDQETGQYYLRARYRYYNPVVGRFLQEDTYREDGLNLYAYCANNSVSYFDPSGHQKCTKPQKTEPDKTKGKKVTNPDGKKGGQAHRDKIESIKPSRDGGKIVREARFDTTGGYKNSRYADAVEIVDEKITSIHQVGKVNKNGLPVARESRAIEDIMLSDEYNGAPIYFWPYNSDMGPIIYQQ